MVRRLLYLNGLAVITVVLYHASAWGFIAMFFWTDQYRQVSVPNFDMLGSPTYFVLRSIEQLIIYGIPTFLFVSGFFISVSVGRSKRTVGWSLIFSRVKNLFIPFLIWSIVIIGLEILQGARFGPLEFVRTILLGQTTDAYYFVPVLIQLYLLAPLLAPYARDRWKLLLLITGAIQLFVIFLRYYQILGIDPGILSPLMFLTRSWFFPGYLFWFSSGIVIGFHLDEFKETFHRWRWGFVSGLGLFFILGMVEWELLLSASGEPWIGPRETLVDNIYAGFFLLTFFAFPNAPMIFSNQIGNLGKRSYGIYLTHSPALEYTARIVYNVAPVILAYQIIFQPILYLAGFGIPLLLMAFVNRSPFRRYYTYLFG